LNIKRSYLLIALAFFFVAAAFFIYRWRERQLFSSVWSFIPQNAILVVRSEQPARDLRQWQESAPGKTVRKLPYFRKLESRLANLKGASDEISKWLEKTPVVASLHVTSPDDFDYVFYLPLSSGNDRELFGKAVLHFTSGSGYRSDSRKFGGMLIREITHMPSTIRFSYILHESILVCSFSPFLLEDVVRTLNQTSTFNPNSWTALHKSYPAEATGPQLYTSMPGLPRLAQVFSSAVLDGQMRDLAHLGRSARVTATSTAEGFLLEGEGKVAEEKETFDFLATFGQQKGMAPACMHLIPVRTAVWQRWSASDSRQWAIRLKQYWLKHEPGTIATQAALTQRYGIPVANFTNHLGNEIALVTPENSDSPAEKLLFVQVTARDQVLSFLNGLADAAGGEDGSKSYRERIYNTLVRQIGLPEFPAALLGNTFSGFTECFFAQAGNYLIFASSLPAMRRQLADMQAGNVWINSSSLLVLAQQSDENAHYTYFSDLTRSWPLLLQSTSLHWQRLLQNHAATLGQFNWLMLQCRNLPDNRFSIKARLHYAEDSTNAQVRNKYFVNYRSSLDTALRIAPTIVRSHLDQSQEVLLQDAANRLYLMGKDGKVLWRKWIEKPVSGEVHQIDYLKNSKLQYLFATERKLHLLDRNGNAVGNFPIRVPALAPLQSAAVFDYENNLEYRFLAQDLVGNLFLYDKAGKVLDGWNPLRLGSRLQGPVRHLRIRNKDYLIALQVDGTVHVLNRKGKEYAGFPLTLSRSINPPYVEQGTDPENTVVTVLTNKGEIARFNLGGNLLDRQQLYQPSKNTLFRIAVDPSRQGSWLIVRQDEQSISILDRKGTLLFTKEAEPQGKYQVQYYNFGAGLRLIAFTDLARNQMQLFDLTGNQVGDKELPSSFPASILYSDHFDKLLLYTGNGRQVQLTSMKVR
jgi:hypothetical protein